MTLLGCGGSTQGAGDRGPSAEELMDRYCANHCGEFATEAECQAAARESWTDAIANGCASEFDANMRCVTSHEPMCSQAMAEDCTPLRRAFEDCSRASAPPDCAHDVSSEPDADGLYRCGYYCDTPTASECTGPAGGPFECTCTMGTNTGATFSVLDCSEAIITATTATCS